MMKNQLMYLNIKHLADLMTDEIYLKEKTHNNDLICKGSSIKIVATAVMCTVRQGYFGCYAYWIRKNLRKTIDSTRLLDEKKFVQGY